jgi:hypothetical protein
MSTKFDEWLEGELLQGFTAANSRPVPSEPRYRLADTSYWRNPMVTAFTAFSPTRILAPLLAAGLIVGGSTAAFAATGSTPAALTQQVSAAVDTCKANLATGEHGIGDCVSDFVQARHNASATVGNDVNHGKPNNNADVKGNASDKNNRPANANDKDVPSTQTNHGSVVSAVARQGEDHGDKTSSAAQSGVSGEQHGNAVSNVARQGEEHGDAVSAAAGGQTTSTSGGTSESSTVSSAARSSSTSGEAHGDAVSAAARNAH